jgi:hypothetical protein
MKIGKHSKEELNSGKRKSTSKQKVTIINRRRNKLPITWPTVSKRWASYAYYGHPAWYEKVLPSSRLWRVTT